MRLLRECWGRCDCNRRPGTRCRGGVSASARDAAGPSWAGVASTPRGAEVNALVTALLALAIGVLVALIAVGPIRAVREDRAYAAEERGWLDSGRFPVEVERLYRNSRLILTDGARLRQLGYAEAKRRRVRGPWGRILEVRWRAAGPPARREAAEG